MPRSRRSTARASAARRCACCCLQEEIADDVLRLLRGWMDELVIGDPALLATDVGPVIDADARVASACAYIGSRRVLHQCRLDARARARPVRRRRRVIELDASRTSQREVFGPVLHVVRYRGRRALAQLVDAINASGYGLTLGVHTRIDAFAQRDRRARARRQRLREPQHDRRAGRRAAVRRHGAVRHRAEGRRTALPAALRDRADRDDEHRGGRRQCDAALARRRRRPPTSALGRGPASAILPATARRSRLLPEQRPQLRETGIVTHEHHVSAGLRRRSDLLDQDVEGGKVQ